MRTLDLLRNHPWNMQATISDRGEANPHNRFEVTVDSIKGFGLVRTTNHETKQAAYAHARAVLGMTEDNPNEQP